MSSQSLCRIILTVLTLACAALRPEHAREQSPTYSTDQYERTLRALDRYRILAANDDGVVLSATVKPVEPGDYYADLPYLIRLLTRVGDLIPRPDGYLTMRAAI
jgi:hypothetical protein